MSEPAKGVEVFLTEWAERGSPRLVPMPQLQINLDRLMRLDPSPLDPEPRSTLAERELIIVMHPDDQPHLEALMADPKTAAELERTAG